MRENILGLPAAEIELHPGRQEVETGLRQCCAALARQHGIESLAQAMQMQYVGGRVGELRLAQRSRAPVARLLLLRQVDVEHLAHQILQAMAVGIGAGQARGDLGAVDRLRHHAKGVIEGGEIEAREVKDFCHLRIGQQRLQVRRVGVAHWNLDDVGAAVAVRHLHHAEPVAMRIEPHGFGVDRDRIRVAGKIRQVAAMQADGHGGRNLVESGAAKVTLKSPTNEGRGASERVLWGVFRNRRSYVNMRRRAATEGAPMKAEAQRLPRFAVLIDADNTSPQIAGGLFEEVAKFGEASVRRIYGDFSGPHLRSWSEILQKHAIDPYQQFAYTKGKNASDIALVIDAMDLLHSGRFDGFCLVSSDSDFTRLASRIREQGVDVFGFGEQKTPASFRQACRKFIYTENLLAGTANTQDAAAKSPLLQPPDAAIAMIKKVIAQMESEDGWVGLGEVGKGLTNLAPDFDSRTYGSRKLSDLVRKTNAFEIEQPKAGGTTRIRIKPAAGPPAKTRAARKPAG